MTTQGFITLTCGGAENGPKPIWLLSPGTGIQRAAVQNHPHREATNSNSHHNEQSRQFHYHHAFARFCDEVFIVARPLPIKSPRQEPVRPLGWSVKRPKREPPTTHAGSLKP